jgi:coenzyme F420-dependent glucose-6-phosphate dehydrogenase
MTEFGYKLCSEEHGPRELARLAARAEEVGFTFGVISDHFHPWTDSQGESPFVWGAIGAISETTERLEIGTGVTCPTIRTHPAIIAHAAATAAVQLPGRFFLGVGTGENLNEHILGDRWPPVDMRREMLEEAIELIRELWRGELTSHYGEHYVVENARIYTRPDEPPPIHVAASGEQAAELAATAGDGLICSSPKAETVEAYRRAGGDGPRYTELTVCWAETEQEARRTALKYWPNAGLKGPLSQELALPSYFEAAAEMVSEDDIAEAVVCGPDPEPHLEQLRSAIEAGFDHVFLHQIGPDQEGFFRFYEREVLPRVGELAKGGGASANAGGATRR